MASLSGVEDRQNAIITINCKIITFSINRFWRGDTLDTTGSLVLIPLLEVTIINIEDEIV